MSKFRVGGFIFGLFIGIVIISPFSNESYNQEGVYGISSKTLSYSAASKPIYPKLLPSYIKYSHQKDLINKEIANVLKNSKGSFGLYVKYLKSNAVISVDGDREFFAASLYKIPVAIALFKNIETNNLELNEKLKDSLNKLLKQSDNDAQYYILQLIPKKTLNEVFRSISGNTRFESSNIASPKEVSKYFEELLHPKLISEKNARSILDLLTNTSYEDRISKALPNDRFSHKIGNWPKTGSWHDCGIVFAENPYIICLMSENTTLEETAKTAKKIVRYLRTF